MAILPHIPHPVLTREGAFSLQIDSCELVITNFIEGQVVGFGALPEPVLACLAEMVGIGDGEPIGDYVANPAGDKFKLVVFAPHESLAIIPPRVARLAVATSGPHSLSNASNSANRRRDSALIR